MKSNTIIIGLGAAGAFLYSLFNEEVLAIERNEEAGRKLLLSGGGRCNYAPSFDDISSHYYDKKNFVTPALLTLPPSKIRSYLKELNVESKTEGDKLFPITDKASSIRDALIKNEKNIRYGEKVLDITKGEDCYYITTTKEKYEAKHLVIATGGITQSKTGSDGSMFKILKSLSEKIIDLRPTLSEIIIEDNPLRNAEGVSLSLKLKKGKEEMSGDAVITRNGISGPVAENFSHYIDGDDEIEIAFSSITKEELNAIRSKALVKNALNISERVIEAIAPSLSSKRFIDLKKNEKEMLFKALTGYKANVSVNSKKAMCTRGGIDTKGINRKTMESKTNKNLYIIGEALDVDGECGGFNIAWAFSSAALAYLDIKKKNDIS